MKIATEANWAVVIALMLLPFGLSAQTPTNAPASAAQTNLISRPRTVIPPQILEKYDTNKDGDLDESERSLLRQDMKEGKVAMPARRPNLDMVELPPEVLAKYDTNKDGKLDDKERAAFRKDLQDRKVQPPARRNPESVQRPVDELLRKYDTNKDGKLDETERAAVKKDIQEGKLVLPGRPPRAPESPTPAKQ